jgi:hypothetical protein
LIESYLVLANRIRKELEDIAQIVTRAERAVVAARKNPEDQDLLIDSAALNLHDLYSGLERIFQQIAATVDGCLPAGPEWHRELLQQMRVDLPKLCPPVMSDEIAGTLEEYLRFRHVVRNVYTFTFDPDQIARLVNKVRTIFAQVQNELEVFARFLEMVGGEE